MKEYDSTTMEPPNIEKGKIKVKEYLEVSTEKHYIIKEYQEDIKLYEKAGRLTKENVAITFGEYEIAEIDNTVEINSKFVEGDIVKVISVIPRLYVKKGY